MPRPQKADNRSKNASDGVDKSAVHLVSEPAPCPCCDAMTQTYLQVWMYRCPDCGYEGSYLDQKKFSPESLLGWDDAAERSMAPLRAINADKILGAIDKIRPISGARLLDVGCAAGWFLSASADRGMVVKGVEPDSFMAARARDSGYDIIEKTFPEPSLPSDGFDVVSFNDVFEHLSNLPEIMQEVDRVLAPDGLLVLSLPSNKGFIYRISTIASQLGLSRFLERLWQKGYESPHIHYFNHHSLQVLAARYGFSLQTQTRLASLTLRGLKERVDEDGKGAYFVNLVVLIGLVLVYPFLRFLMPSDAILHIYSKNK